MIAWLKEDANRCKGEIVLVVEGAVENNEEQFNPQALLSIQLISRQLPLKKAAAIVAEVYGYKKNALYQYGLQHFVNQD